MVSCAGWEAGGVYAPADSLPIEMGTGAGDGYLDLEAATNAARLECRKDCRKFWPGGMGGVENGVMDV